MLPVVVLVLAGIYLVLHYSGAFESIASRPKSTGPQFRPRRTVEEEIEKRLKVFEDFFESGGDDDEGSTSA